MTERSSVIQPRASLLDRVVLRQEALLFGAALLVLALLQAAPFIVLVVEALQSSRLSLLTEGALWQLFGRTVARSAGVSLGAVLIGVPLGVLLGRCDVPCRRLLLALHTFPVFLPPFLPALGWFRLMGEHGWLGSKATSAWFFGSTGLTLVHISVFAPVVTVFVALAASGIDASLIEAGRLAARPGYVIRRLLIPAVRPVASIGALIVFALSFAEMAVPMFLRVGSYPGAVFARLGGLSYEPGDAILLTIPLLILAGVLGVTARRLGWRQPTIRGLRLDAEPLPLGRWRLPLSLVVAGVLALGLTPLVALMVAACQVTAWPLSELVTSGGMSVLTGAISATVIIALAVPIGYRMARGVGGARFADALLTLSFVTPATVLGVGLMTLWNRPVTGVVYGSPALLVIGYVSRYAVVGVYPVAMAWAQTSIHAEEVAALAGASWVTRLRRVLIPAHAKAFLWGWAIAFVFCLRDLELSVLYYPPGAQPLTVRIFTLEANGRESVIAALATGQIVLTAAVLLVTGLLTRRIWWTKRA